MAGDTEDDPYRGRPSDQLMRAESPRSRTRRAYDFLRDKVRAGADGYKHGGVQSAVGAVLGSGPAASPAFDEFRWKVALLQGTVQAFGAISANANEWNGVTSWANAIKHLALVCGETLAIARLLLAEHESHWGDIRRRWEASGVTLQRLAAEAGNLRDQNEDDRSRGHQIFLDALQAANVLVKELRAAEAAWDNPRRPG